MAQGFDLLQRGFSGMGARPDGSLRFKPRLPIEIERLSFWVYFRRHWMDVHVEDGNMKLHSEVTDQPPVEVEFRGQRATFASGETKAFHTPG